MDNLKVGDYVRFCWTEEEDEELILGYCGVIVKDNLPSFVEYKIDFLAPFPKDQPLSRFLIDYEDDFWCYPEHLEKITEQEAMLWKLRN